MFLLVSRQGVVAYRTYEQADEAGFNQRLSPLYAILFWDGVLGEWRVCEFEQASQTSQWSSTWFGAMAIN